MSMFLIAFKGQEEISSADVFNAEGLREKFFSVIEDWDEVEDVSYAHPTKENLTELLEFVKKMKQDSGWTIFIEDCLKSWPVRFEVL